MDLRLGDDALRTAVTDLRGTLDALESTRSQAAAQVGRVFDGAWSGRAAAAFADAWDDWLVAAAAVSRGLADLGEAMAATERDLGATDREVADRSAVLVDRLADRLG